MEIHSKTRTNFKLREKLIILLFMTVSLRISAAKTQPIIPAVGKNGKFGFINQRGKILIPFRFIQVKLFHEGLACAAVLSKTGTVKWGYINPKGSWVIPPLFNLARSFHEGLAAVGYQRLPKYRQRLESLFPLTQAHWGFINQKGKFMIKPQFKKALSFSEGLAAVCISKGCGYIDSQGKWIILPHYLSAFSFHEGIARVFTGRFGFINKKGDWIVKPHYDDAGSFSDGLALLSNFRKHDGYYGYINKSGKILIPFQFKVAYPFSERLAFVVKQIHKKTELGYINPLGKMVIHLPENIFFHYRPWQANQETFQNGLALLAVQSSKGIRYGYINHTGKWKIPPKFRDALPFYHGTAEVKIKKKWGDIINKKGEIIWTP